VAAAWRCQFLQRAGDARGRATSSALSVRAASDQRGVKRAIERAMGEQDWQDAGPAGKARTANCAFRDGAGIGGS
jgi:DnaJ-domain-containing protein 1